jgi:hypothetical protein
MRQVATALAERYGMSYNLPTDVATFYAEAHEYDQALEWLDRAYEVRDPNLPYIEWYYDDTLRSDPRFQDLLRRMNLPTTAF